MALRKILSEKEKENLIESPVLKEDIIRWYTLTESDIIIIGVSRRKVILGELKDWSPVQLNGEKVAAITTKVVFPEALFENYK